MVEFTAYFPFTAGKKNTGQVRVVKLLELLLLCPTTKQLPVPNRGSLVDKLCPTCELWLGSDSNLRLKWRNAIDCRENLETIRECKSMIFEPCSITGFSQIVGCLIVNLQPITSHGDPTWCVPPLVIFQILLADWLYCNVLQAILMITILNCAFNGDLILSRDSE